MIHPVELQKRVLSHRTFHFLASHFDTPLITSFENPFEQEDDISCLICYSPTTFLSLSFLSFWQSIPSYFNCGTYSFHTIQIFETLETTPDPFDRIHPINQLIESITYLEYPSTFEDLFNFISEYFNQYNYIKSPTISDTYSETTEITYTQPLLLPPPLYNNTMDPQQLQALLTQVGLIGGALRFGASNIITPFSGGDQDPTTWFDQFERNANATGLNDDMKLQTVPAYLKDAAADWWTEQSQAANNINNWNQDNNRSFKRRFIGRFRTDEKVNSWWDELENRTQKANESVEKFAQDIRHLLKKVDPNTDMGERNRVRHFTKNLLADIRFQVQMMRPDTLTAAIEIAKRVEASRQQLQTATLQSMMPGMAFSIPNSPPPTSEVNELKKMVEQLTTQVRQLTDKRRTNGQPQRPYQPQERRNQPPNRQGQGITCYRCSQPGHFARECPHFPPPSLPIPAP